MIIIWKCLVIKDPTESIAFGRSFRDALIPLAVAQVDKRRVPKSANFKYDRKALFCAEGRDRKTGLSVCVIRTNIK